MCASVYVYALRSSTILPVHPKHAYLQCVLFHHTYKNSGWIPRIEEPYICCTTGLHDRIADGTAPHSTRSQAAAVIIMRLSLLRDPLGRSRGLTFIKANRPWLGDNNRSNVVSPPWGIGRDLTFIKANHGR